MARGRSERRRSGGFTLVEILVVVVIIGIIAAGAILSLSNLGRDRELETESDRLIALMNYAHEQASLQTREFGLYCSQHGYRFLAFNPVTNLWEDLTEDDALHPRVLPDGLTVFLSVEAKDVVLSKSNDVTKVSASDLLQASNALSTQSPAALQSAGGAALGAAGSSSGSTLGSASGSLGSGSSSLASSSSAGSAQPTFGVSQGTTVEKDPDTGNPLMPHVMIFSNGDLTSFELTLARDGTERKATLVADDQGRIKLKDPATPPGGKT
jgi:type II secretion system protein H